MTRLLERRFCTKASLIYVAIWLLTSAIAIVMAMQFDTASFVDGHHIPVGNDSFYHARRILDAAIGERGFYQFDDMIHVPDGSWLTWPWAYDYLMARALIVALWISPSLEPMTFLAYVPVVWVFVNIALLTMIGRQIGLGAGFTAIGVLGFALLPLNQTLHGIGAIDHHYMELTFVLGTLLAGLRFFSSGSGTRNAITIGVILGIAPAFHNGLFALQIPVLAAVFILWLKQVELSPNRLLWLAGALVTATLLVALPSAPFQAMQFEYWTLSWFHLYVATCSGVCLIYLGWRPFSKANLAYFFILAIVMVIPVIAKILMATAFLAGDLILLDLIKEVKSPVIRIAEPGGLIWTTNYFSWLLFLVPVYIAVFALRLWRSLESADVFLSVFTIFGSVLMLTQFRLHPFGSWALLFAGLLLVNESRSKFGLSRLAASALSLLVMAIAFQPPLRNQLFFEYAPGGTIEYAASRGLFHSLATACEVESGAVLSYSDDGHHIRYHTDCSVLTNNFLLTPLHERKILEGNAYLGMMPEQFLKAAPHIKYLFVRMYGVFDEGPDGWTPAPVSKIKERNALLFVALTFSQDIPKGFRLVDEIRIEDERDFPFARVFEVVHDD